MPTTNGLPTQAPTNQALRLKFSKKSSQDRALRKQKLKVAKFVDELIIKNIYEAFKKMMVVMSFSNLILYGFVVGPNCLTVFGQFESLKNDFCPGFACRHLSSTA